MTSAPHRIPKADRVTVAPLPHSDGASQPQAAWTAAASVYTDGLKSAYATYGCLPKGTRATSLWCVPSAEATALVDARVAKIAAAQDDRAESEQAIYELSQVYGPRVVDFVLADLLRNQFQWGIEAIIEAMGRRRAATPEVVLALADFIGSQSFRSPIRKEATYALLQIGHPAIPILVSAMKNGKSAATRALTVFGDRVHPDLAEALKEGGNESVQADVLEALDEMQVYPKALMPAAISLIAFASHNVRYKAIRYLGHSGTQDTTVLTAILASLNLHRGVLNRTAVEAIGDLGIPSARANEVLRTIIREDKYEAASQALVSLGKIGGRDPESVALVVEVAKGETLEDHQYTAIEALGAMRPVSPEAIAVAIDYLDDQQLADDAERALEKMGQAAVPALLERVGSLWSEAKISQAMKILGRMGSPAKAALPTLRQASRHYLTSAEIRSDANLAIREIEGSLAKAPSVRVDWRSRGLR